MSRVTAPSKQLARSINSAAAAARSSSLLDHNAGATLMPKYAELLRRSNEHSDSSRGLTTTHRPTPQPSIANRTKPLMQTFSSAAVSRTPSSNLDAAVLPSMDSLWATKPSASPAVPILPDNYAASNAQVEDAPVTVPEVTILAADPEKVLSGSPLNEVQGFSLDGVDFKFAHEQPQQEQQAAAAGQELSGGMLRDLWKGMVEDVLGTAPGKKIA